MSNTNINEPQPRGKLRNSMIENEHGFSYESAAKEIEQEKKMVAALKRLSIGNMMNYDPDLPNNDEIEFQFQFSDNNKLDDRIRRDKSPSRSPSPSISPSKISPVKSTKSSNSSHSPSPSRLSRSNSLKDSSFNISTTIDDSLDDSETLDTEELLWVPANLHPEVDPENYKNHVHTTVEELMERQISRKNSLKRGSSLSKSISRHDSTKENDDPQISPSKDEGSLRTPSSNSSSPSPNKELSPRPESNRYSNPSLRDLSNELQHLSKLAGRNSTDAVTVARTLSASSLGYTDVERLAIDELNSSPRSSQSSIDDFYDPSSPASQRTYDELSFPYETNPNANDTFDLAQDFALKRSKRVDYRNQPLPQAPGSKLQTGKADKLANLRTGLTNDPSLQPQFTNYRQNHPVKHERHRGYQAHSETPSVSSKSSSHKSRSHRNSQALFTYGETNLDYSKDSPYGSVVPISPLEEKLPSTKYSQHNLTAKRLSHVKITPQQQAQLSGRNPTSRSSSSKNIPQLQPHAQIHPQSSQHSQPQQLSQQPQPQQLPPQPQPQGHRSSSRSPSGGSQHSEGYNNYPYQQVIYSGTPKSRHRNGYVNQNYHGHQQHSHQHSHQHKHSQQGQQPMQRQGQRVPSDKRPDMRQRPSMRNMGSGQIQGQPPQGQVPQGQVPQGQVPQGQPQDQRQLQHQGKVHQSGPQGYQQMPYGQKPQSQVPHKVYMQKRSHSHNHLSQQSQQSQHQSRNSSRNVDVPTTSVESLPDLSKLQNAPVVQQVQQFPQVSQSEELSQGHQTSPEEKHGMIRHPSQSDYAEAKLEQTVRISPERKRPTKQETDMKSRQLNENLNLLRSEINDFKESLSRNDKISETPVSIESSDVDTSDFSFERTYPEINLEEQSDAEKETLEKNNVLDEQETLNETDDDQTKNTVDEIDFHEISDQSSIDVSPTEKHEESSGLDNLMMKNRSNQSLVSNDSNISASSLKQSPTKPLKKKKSWPWMKNIDKSDNHHSQRSVSASTVELATVPESKAISSRSVSSPEVFHKEANEPTKKEKELKAKEEAKLKKKKENIGKENVISKLFKRKRSNSVSVMEEKTKPVEESEKMERIDSPVSVESQSPVEVSDYESDLETKKSVPSLNKKSSGIFKKKNKKEESKSKLGLKLLKSSSSNSLNEHIKEKDDPMEGIEVEQKEPEMEVQKEKVEKKVEKKSEKKGEKKTEKKDTEKKLEKKASIDKKKKPKDEKKAQIEEKEANVEGKLEDEEEKPLQTTLEVQEKLKKSIKRTSKANQPIEFTDSAFGFPLPPPSPSTLVMLDYRFPVHVERAIYRLSHLKLANPKRSLREQVLLSNFMYAYLNLVDHTLHLEQQMNESMTESNDEDNDKESNLPEEEMDDNLNFNNNDEVMTQELLVDSLDLDIEMSKSSVYT
ncbi:hypothetical protein CLIB1444_11S02344 [[Candida] jaroonii]|uniref:Uncharacterized protein n=1 Tax=[Candida] jaroonii TaxID=467808 RepID=A0ACA9YCP7_9ASCO|nr:hypothetical protein CLIB1444_11S02344 [[Candida] jaroonii]